MTVHVSIPLEEDQAAQLDAIAQAKAATRADVLVEAVRDFLDYDSWFRSQVKIGLDSIEAGDVMDMDVVFERLGRHMDATEGQK